LGKKPVSTEKGKVSAKEVTPGRGHNHLNKSMKIQNKVSNLLRGKCFF
jgi:hypothetical protein